MDHDKRGINFLLKDLETVSIVVKCYKKQ